MARRAGFTLLEVLVVIGVAAALTAVAFPMMQTMRQNASLNGGVQEFVSILRQTQGNAAAGKGNADQVITFIASNPCQYSTPLLGTFTAQSGISCFKHGTTTIPDGITFKKLTGVVTTGAGFIDMNTKTIEVGSTGTITIQ